jgi:hypothetical protein
VYDRERFTAREILMAVFEDDVRGGMNHSARMRVVVNQAGTQ